MVEKTALAELLAYDIPVTQIAQAFGVSSQYIQNLLREDEELQSLLQEKATEVAVREHNSRVNLEVIKHDLLDKIRAQIDMSDGLIESVKALQLITDIEGKTRAMAHGAGAEGPKAGIIELNLNIAASEATLQIQKNGNNEIISIAGRNMAPMPASKVLEAVKERKANGESEESDRGDNSPGQRGDDNQATYTREYETSAL